VVSSFQQVPLTTHSVVRSSSIGAAAARRPRLLLVRDDDSPEERYTTNRLGDYYYAVVSSSSTSSRRRRRRAAGRAARSNFQDSASPSGNSRRLPFLLFGKKSDGGRSGVGGDDSEVLEREEYSAVPVMAAFVTNRLGRTLIQKTLRKRSLQQELEEEKQLLEGGKKDTSPIGRETATEKSEKVEEVPTTTTLDWSLLDAERPAKLHTREGDRVVALGDQFSPQQPLEEAEGGAAPEDAAGEEKTSAYDQQYASMMAAGGGGSSAKKKESPTASAGPVGPSGTPATTTTDASGDEAAETEIDTESFGRPLEVVESNVPAMRDPPIAKPATMEKSSPPLAPSVPISTTAPSDEVSATAESVSTHSDEVPATAESVTTQSGEVPATAESVTTQSVEVPATSESPFGQSTAPPPGSPFSKMPVVDSSSSSTTTTHLASSEPATESKTTQNEGVSAAASSSPFGQATMPPPGSPFAKKSVDDSSSSSASPPASSIPAPETITAQSEEGSTAASSSFGQTISPAPESPFSTIADKKESVDVSKTVSPFGQSTAPTPWSPFSTKSDGQGSNEVSRTASPFGQPSAPTPWSPFSTKSDNKEGKEESKTASPFGQSTAPSSGSPSITKPNDKSSDEAPKTASPFSQPGSPFSTKPGENASKTASPFGQSGSPFPTKPDDKGSAEASKMASPFGQPGSPFPTKPADKGSAEASKTASPFDLPTAATGAPKWPSTTAAAAAPPGSPFAAKSNNSSNTSPFSSPWSPATPSSTSPEATASPETRTEVSATSIGTSSSVNDKIDATAPAKDIGGDSSKKTSVPGSGFTMQQPSKETTTVEETEQPSSREKEEKPLSDVDKRALESLLQETEKPDDDGAGASIEPETESKVRDILDRASPTTGSETDDNSEEATPKVSSSAETTEAEMGTGSPASVVGSGFTMAPASTTTGEKGEDSSQTAVKNVPTTIPMATGSTQAMSGGGVSVKQAKELTSDAEGKAEGAALDAPGSDFAIKRLDAESEDSDQSPSTNSTTAASGSGFTLLRPESSSDDAPETGNGEGNTDEAPPPLSELSSESRGTDSDNDYLSELIRSSTCTLDGREIRGPITPIGNIVLVKVKETLTATDGGILLPDQAKERPTEGIVIAAGPGRIHPFTGVRIPNPIKTGMSVLYGKFDGRSVEYNGDDCQVIRDDDVLIAYEGVTMKLDNLMLIRDYVLVETEESKDKSLETSSGVAVAAQVMADNNVCQGQVVKVGPGRTASDGKSTKSPVQPGETVKFKDYAGNDVLIEGKLYSVVKMVDILATRSNEVDNIDDAVPQSSSERSLPEKDVKQVNEESEAAVSPPSPPDVNFIKTERKAIKKSSALATTGHDDVGEGKLLYAAHTILFYSTSFAVLFAGNKRLMNRSTFLRPPAFFNLVDALGRSAAATISMVKAFTNTSYA